MVTRLVVGLGNPGADYVGTRHNVGFEVVERLARSGDQLFQSARRLTGYRGASAFEWARLSDRDALLLKPLTYMNLSGRVVAPVAHFLAAESGAEELDPGSILTVYDDLDLPFGKLRIRPHGGAGGHRGVRSIIEHLGTDRFRRVRIGIGNPRTDAARHVLDVFRPEEREEMDITVAEAAEAIDDWLRSGDIEACMTRFHSRWNADS